MQRSIKAVTSPFHCKMTLPGSKSITYRALLLAALADGVSEISGIRLCEQVRTFIHAIHQLGIVTQLEEKSRSCIIAGGNGHFPKKQSTVWCDNTKIVARFLLAACAPTPGVFYFDGASKLRQKSMATILNVLTRQGVQIIPNDTERLPFTIIGSDSLQGGDVHLNKEINSQMLSALLMISPFARTPFSFTISDLANQPNINITCTLMNEFGVLVRRYHQSQFTVPVPQRYQARDIIVEPDFSIGVYFFAATAITHSELTIQAVHATTSKQGDATFLKLLEQMGCKIHEANTGLVVKSTNELQGIEANLPTFGATFLALCATAPFANSPTHISHLGNLSKKDKKRLAMVESEFLKLNIRMEADANSITIFPSTPKGAPVNAHGDPHIAMMLATLGTKIPGITIDDTTCVNQIYPEFFNQLETLAEDSSINA